MRKKNVLPALNLEQFGHPEFIKTLRSLIPEDLTKHDLDVLQAIASYPKEKGLTGDIQALDVVKLTRKLAKSGPPNISFHQAKNVITLLNKFAAEVLKEPAAYLYHAKTIDTTTTRLNGFWLDKAVEAGDIKAVWERVAGGLPPKEKKSELIRFIDLVENANPNQLDGSYFSKVQNYHLTLSINELFNDAINCKQYYPDEAFKYGEKLINRRWKNTANRAVKILSDLTSDIINEGQQERGATYFLDLVNNLVGDKPNAHQAWQEIGTEYSFDDVLDFIENIDMQSEGEVGDILKKNDVKYASILKYYSP